MSLEESIQKLTAAIEANTKALTGGEAPAKAAGKPAAKPAGKPAGKPAAKKGPTVDDIADKFGEYMKTGDKDEREEAKTNVKAIVAHFGVSRLTEIDPENFQQALDFLDQFKAGENPFEDEEEENEEDLM